MPIGATLRDSLVWRATLLWQLIVQPLRALIFSIWTHQFTFPRSASRDARVFAGPAADHVGPICAVGPYRASEVREDPIAVRIAERTVPFDRAVTIGEVK